MNFLLKRQTIITVVFITLFHFRMEAQLSSNMPKLVKVQNTVQLMVENKLFLVFGGELGNSNASSNAYMRRIWPKLKQMNLNTVFAPVYWELVEPQEDKFDFSSLDTLIANARQNQIKLVLLWFGAWKNSMSSYAPPWVKTATARFPRALDKNSVPQEILTPFNKNNLTADVKAFAAMMDHIKRTDEKDQTVITIQVENEIGMLPDARTYDKEANDAFRKPIPKELIGYLVRNKQTLLPETKQIWESNGSKTSGNWEEVFGKGPAADEIFMAWHYAAFTNEMVKAGKSIYALPMYVNAALNRPGWLPGAYPSAGPLPHILDFWKAAAPQMDIFSPDIYFPDFKHWADLYTRNQNPLFIPETGSGANAAAKALFAFGNYNCLGYSPFSIESAFNPETDPMTKVYDALRQVSHLITKYQPSGNVKGFLLESDSSQADVLLGDFTLTIKHELSTRRTPSARDTIRPAGGVLIIAVASDEYYIIGTSIVTTFTPLAKNKRAGLLFVDEGVFENEQWIPGRRMNGDQNHQGRHVRSPQGQYSIQRVKLYTY